MNPTLDAPISIYLPSCSKNVNEGPNHPIANFSTHKLYTDGGEEVESCCYRSYAEARSWLVKSGSFSVEVPVTALPRQIAN